MTGSDSDSSDDQDSDLGSEVCQAGKSKQGCRTKSKVHTSWGDSQDCQTPTLKPSLDFCVVNHGSQGGAEVDVGFEGVFNKQISAVSANTDD